jgi:hypothetical protein
MALVFRSFTVLLHFCFCHFPQRPLSSSSSCFRRFVCVVFPLVCCRWRNMGNTLCSVPIAVRMRTTKSGSRIDVHWERPLERGQGRGRIRSYRIEVEVDSVTQTAYEQAHYASFVGRAQSIRMAREWGARAATAAATGNDALVASCIAGQVNAAAPAGAPVAPNWVAMAENDQSCVMRRVRGRVAYSTDLRVHHGVRYRIKVTPETGMGDGPAVTREIAAQPDAQA